MKNTKKEEPQSYDQLQLQLNKAMQEKNFKRVSMIAQKMETIISSQEEFKVAALEQVAWLEDSVSKLQGPALGEVVSALGMIIHKTGESARGVSPAEKAISLYDLYSWQETARIREICAQSLAYGWRDGKGRRMNNTRVQNCLKALKDYSMRESVRSGYVIYQIKRLSPGHYRITR